MSSINRGQVCEMCNYETVGHYLQITYEYMVDTTMVSVYKNDFIMKNFCEFKNTVYGCV